MDVLIVDVQMHASVMTHENTCNSNERRNTGSFLNGIQKQNTGMGQLEIF
jgi:hypothetical protein